jgi:hypothetical protein
MRFMEGMIVGGLLATGATLMYTNNYNKTNPKKMMKKGKQLVKKMGIM